MKRIFWMIVLSVALCGVYAQKSIDALFNRYAGKEGFVTVTLSGDLLKLAGLFDNDKDNNRSAGKITELRILAQDKGEMKVNNFYDLVIKDINTQDYEEFMRVKESDRIPMNNWSGAKQCQ